METQEQFCFFLGASNFSVYEAMGKLLLERGNWRCERSKTRMKFCDVVLGDRFDIPYYLLRERCGNRKLLINYFKGSHKLTLKASMSKVLSNCPESQEWMPETFVLSAKEGATDQRDLLETRMNGSDAWILKPSAGSHGTGILISRDFAEIAQVVASSPGAIFACQRYIDRPLLIDGRKFDVRVWALLAAPYSIYLFSQGSCRTASLPYSENIGNTLEHITNHCLQEQCEQFGHFEEGNEMWFGELDQYFEKRGIPVRVRSHLFPQFSRIIITSLLSVRDLLEVDSFEPFSCFQIFGYDFVVDSSFRVHLLEINGSPGSAQKWLTPLVRETVELVIDPLFPTPPSVPPKVQCAAEERCASSDAKWELVWQVPHKCAESRI